MGVSCCDEHTMYTAGCEPCRERARMYAHNRNWGVYGGTWDRVFEGEALDRVRQHVQVLLATPGVTIPKISMAAGISSTRLYVLAGAKQMRPHVADALLALTAQRVIDYVDSHSDTARISALGTKRRLQALARDGWGSKEIAEHVGVHHVTIGHWRVGRHRTVLLKFHRAVAEFYDKIQGLADTTGPSGEARRQAERRDYPLPEQWLDETIDDPDAQPLPPPPDDEDWVAVTNQIDDALRHPAPGKAADYPRPVKREIARHATGRLGWPLERVAELLGFNSTYSVEYLLRGRKDRKPPKERK